MTDILGQLRSLPSDTVNLALLVECRGEIERLREIEEWAHRAGALDGNRRLKEALQTNDCEHRWSDPSKDASPVACTKCGDPKVREMTKDS